MKKEYVGTWRIEKMEQWDKDFIDLVQPGQITIRRDGIGSLRFGAVQVEMDCRIEKFGQQERMAFTFEGSDEGDPCSGRGWASVTGSEMNGRIFFHLGDESGFKALKSK